MLNLAKIVLNSMLILAFIAIPVTVFGQGPGMPQPPEGVPLDPMSWMLLAGGGFIAAKKIYNESKK